MTGVGNTGGGRRHENVTYGLNNLPGAHRGGFDLGWVGFCFF